MKKILYTAILGLTLITNCHAEIWGTTNAQYLYGTNFDQLVGGDSVVDGDMSTITLEHVGGWDYGLNFFFIDLTSGDFSSGKTQKIYAEWAPKLSLSKTTGKDFSFGFIKDTYIAAEINQGDNFRANNIGLAVTLDVPGFNFFDFNLYHRNDNFNDATFQITIAWDSTFTVASLPLIFQGFMDYYGIDYGTQTVGQPRLLLDGKFFGDHFTTLQAGVELYYYRSSATPYQNKIEEAVPQLMIKWIW